MAHGENWKKNNPFKFAAWEMAQVFEHNSDGEGSVTEEGMVLLISLFGNVDREDRALVFTLFLDELNERGLDYDTSKFYIKREDVPVMH